ncbi:MULTISPECIES: universal stress protein [unclassified Streptomyces]|uniref:universal stress protein n=1 Tax=unclassified Streptomyces TaxID=2593676 RepID=UPI00278C3187|nr:MULTISPECIES: universal stress protein [unclassified Streptomyces]
MAGHVLVGADGSESSLDAVAVAAREARQRGLGLRIVHAFIWPLMKAPVGAAAEALRGQADTIVSGAVQHARATEPDLTDVEGEVVTGEPLSILAVRSERADLVVVGSRGLGAFTGLLIGSVAVHLAAHAHCPVLVVRGRAAPEGPVAVAVDGSGDAGAALDAAFSEAARLGSALLALHVWNTWTADGQERPHATAPLVSNLDDLRKDAELTLTDALAPGQAAHPDVSVEQRVLEGRVRPALIDASKESRLLVVGARGRGGFQGLLLGSVSQALLQHAHCPVLVVRG